MQDYYKGLKRDAVLNLQDLYLNKVNKDEVVQKGKRSSFYKLYLIKESTTKEDMPSNTILIEDQIPSSPIEPLPLKRQRVTL